MIFPVLQLTLKSEADLIVSRQRVRKLASLCGLIYQDQVKFITALTEILRNAIQYAGGGTVELAIEEQEDGLCIQAKVQDKGPGVVDLNRIFLGTSRSKTGEGIGISGARRLVHRFAVDTSPENGTTVTLSMLIPAGGKNLTDLMAADWSIAFSKDETVAPEEELRLETHQLLVALNDLQAVQTVLDAELARANKLVKELEETNAGFIGLYKELDENKTQLARKTELLEERSSQLMDANRLKGEFLANMSHEIRTPMNAIIGMSELILRVTQDSKQREYLSIIQAASRGLLALIGDILDFSKIEAGKVEVQISDFDLVSAVEGMADILAGQAAAKGLALSTYINPRISCMVSGDPDRLRQILLNLTSNAIKYSERGAVVIRVEPETASANSFVLRFSVRDQGIGLSAAEQARLFQPFVQLDGSTTRGQGGTGLGLSICKRLVELMGGTIGVESTKGKGSTFWFTLPFEQREAIASVARLATVLKGQAVLVVSEEESLREVLSSYLTHWGAKCTVVSNEEEAIAYLTQDGTAGIRHLVFVDMPAGRIQKCKQKIPPRCNAAIIRLFRTWDPEDSKESGEGLQGLLPKPIKQVQLLECASAVHSGNSYMCMPSIGQVTQQPAATHTDGGLILLAEDHPANQVVATLQLGELGYLSHVVSNGREAVDAAATNQYRLILMDCHMPEVDGFQAARFIREHELKTHTHTPIIAMTASATPDERAHCLEVGMDDFISKPVELTELNQVLSKWISSGHVPATPGTAEAAPEPTISSIEPDLDWSRLMRLGPEKAQRILRTFYPSTEACIADAAGALDNSDTVALGDAAHKMKGGCGTVGANQMYRLSQRLEEAAKNSDWALAQNLLVQLRNSFHRIKDQAGAVFR